MPCVTGHSYPVVVNNDNCPGPWPGGRVWLSREPERETHDRRVTDPHPGCRRLAERRGLCAIHHRERERMRSPRRQGYRSVNQGWNEVIAQPDAEQAHGR
jgi:hypothetical protein